MPQRYVRLHIEAPAPATFLGRPSFRCAITVKEAIGLPREIFAFKRTVVDFARGEFQDEFSFVCDPYALSAYPVGEPHPGSSEPYFRKAEIDILLPSVRIYDRFVMEVKQQIEHLLYMMDRLDRLQVQEDLWIPNDPCSSSSSSSSHCAP